MTRLPRLCTPLRRVGTTAALLVAVLPALAAAQQAPLTGQMLGGHNAAPAAPAPLPAAPPAGAAPLPTASAPVERYTPPPPPPRTEIGQTTRDLLRMQAQGTHAGPRLPILGDQAAASYQRYLKSFEHEIPEFLKTSVKKDVSGTN
jgi:hypothetical protein